MRPHRIKDQIDEKKRAHYFMNALFLCDTCDDGYFVVTVINNLIRCNLTQLFQTQFDD